MSETAQDLNDREKAAALDDLMVAFREEYIDVVDHYVTIDGGGSISEETSRVLRLMLQAVR